MNPFRPLIVAVLATGCAVSMAGCSVVDVLIWGNDGAEVIRTTEALIDDLESTGTSDLLCEEFAADLGAAADWTSRSAGEPESFFAGFWEDQVPLDPQWNINLEGLPEGTRVGATFPGDVFYRETDDGLCVIDIVWPTLTDIG